jgi:hypothetical protein
MKNETNLKKNLTTSAMKLNKQEKTEEKIFNFDVAITPEINNFIYPTNKISDRTDNKSKSAHVKKILKSKTSVDFSEKIFNKLKKKKERIPLQLNFCESLKIICSFFCKNKITTKKFNTYAKGKRKIKEYFDFINLIFHLEEAEIIKKLLFNSNQRMMIDLNINPNLNENRAEMKNKIRNMSIESINEHVKEFYSRCNGDISEIDQNILDYLLNS